MVTAQARRGLVQRQPRIAPFAARLPAAGGTEAGRREAAAVDEHERLVPRPQVLVEHPEQAVAQAVPQPPAPHVEHAVPRQRRLAGAARQPGLAIASAYRVLERLQRRRGAAEHDGHAQYPAPLHGHVPGGVAQPLLLLERGVVFLVHHDQAQVRERREDRRARAHEHLVVPVRAPQPRVEAHRVRRGGVERRGAPEPLAETRQGLRRETDLRDEHERLAATRHDLRHRAHVHLGLAAPRHALEHHGARIPRGAGDDFDGPALLVVQVERGRPDAVLRAFLHLFDQPLADQRGKGPAVDPEMADLRVGYGPCEGAQCSQRLGLPGSTLYRAVRFRQPAPGRPQPRRFSAPGRSGEHRAEHLPERMVVVASQPHGEFDQVGRQEAFWINNFGDVLQAALRFRTGARDHADDLAPPERHADARPNRGHGIAGRNGVIEQPPDRTRDRHFHDAVRHEPESTTRARCPACQHRRAEIHCAPSPPDGGSR